MIFAELSAASRTRALWLSLPLSILFLSHYLNYFSLSLSLHKARGVCTAAAAVLTCLENVKLAPSGGIDRKRVGDVPAVQRGCGVGRHGQNHSLARRFAAHNGVARANLQEQGASARITAAFADAMLAARESGATGAGTHPEHTQEEGKEQQRRARRGPSLARH